MMKKGSFSVLGLTDLSSLLLIYGCSGANDSVEEAMGTGKNVGSVVDVELWGC